MADQLLKEKALLKADLRKKNIAAWLSAYGVLLLLLVQNYCVCDVFA